LRAAPETSERYGKRARPNWPGVGYVSTVGSNSLIAGQTIMTTDQIEQELLKLPAADRARLAERLIASLDEDSEVEAAWIAEVRKRDEELQSGAVEAIPIEDALKTIRTRFGW